VKTTASNFSITDINSFKNKMLNWANRFNIFSFLDNNHYAFEAPVFEWVLAAGVKESILFNKAVDFSELKSFHLKQPHWLFGHINYPSQDQDAIGFPGSFFFVPQIIITCKGNNISIESTIFTAQDVFNEINVELIRINNVLPSKVTIQSRYTKEEYIEIIQSLKKHIQRGDCYEINFCQDFFIEKIQLDPVDLYHKLLELSPTPFAALYKLDDNYCICASPERFLKKTGDVVISQPIKGTSKRDHSDATADLLYKEYLLNSAKEKSENVMIVDLVRNDLSRICAEGSVFTKELFGVYSFPQVHQMISTIQGSVKEDVHWTEIIKACYPMGSMTGAPKIKVMELIENYEQVPRGLFSGSIGYVTPAGDFDFNVVIRSIFYNQSKQTLSFKVGGGITFNSDPTMEYEECMIKASAIMKVLSSD